MSKTDQLGDGSNSSVIQCQVVQGVPEVEATQVFAALKNFESVQLVDVRRPEEFVGELGHIEGAKLVTLGEGLARFLQDGNRSDEIVFVCRSGGRSGQATMLSVELGYTKTANLVGGMLRWNELKLPVIRK